MLLKAIGQSGAMLGDDKVYIHMYPSGTLMYPTNDSKKVTEMLQESLREMNCVPLHRRLFEELT